MSKTSVNTNYDLGYADGFADALHKTSKEMLAFLKSIGVVRDSMLGEPWLVIYTENGALDIREDALAKLEGN